MSCYPVDTVHSYGNNLVLEFYILTMLSEYNTLLNRRHVLDQYFLLKIFFMGHVLTFFFNSFKTFKKKKVVLCKAVLDSSLFEHKNSIHLGSDM